MEVGHAGSTGSHSLEEGLTPPGPGTDSPGPDPSPGPGAPRAGSGPGSPLRTGGSGRSGRAGGQSSSLCQQSPAGATRCAPGAGGDTATPARSPRDEEEEEEKEEEDVAGDTGDIPRSELGSLAEVAPRQQQRQQQRQQRPAREDEDEDEDGCDATSTVPTVPAASGGTALGPDLFERLQHAVSSLERTVFSRHRRPPERPLPPAPAWHRAVRSLEELSQTPDWSPQPPDWSPRWWPEVAAAQGLPEEVSRNASLRASLRQRGEELGQATAALRALRGERDRLQGKVQELREALAGLEELAGDTPGTGDTSGMGDTPGVSDTSRTGDTLGAGDASGVCDTPRTGNSPMISDASRVGDTPGPSSPPGRRPLPTQSHAPLSPRPSAGPGPEQEQRLQRLQRLLAQLRDSNRELTAALGECKGEAERLSHELELRAARDTALRLALSCSERCGGAYAALLELVRAKVTPQDGTRGGTAAEPSPAPSPEPPRPEEPEIHRDPEGSPGARSSAGTEEEELRELIRRLRAEQEAVEGSLLDTPEPPGSPPGRDPRGSTERVLREARALLLGWRRPEKEELLQELAVLKEALAELRARLQLAQREKRALELLLAAQGPREAALRLLLQHRERERHGRDGASGSSGSSSGSSSEEEARIGRGAALAPQNRPDPERTREELLRIRARTERLRGRAEELALALEQSSANSRARQAHSVTVTRELLQAHSSLALAYRGARRKQAEQLRRLEVRAAALRAQHGRRERALTRALRNLQRHGETCV